MSSSLAGSAVRTFLTARLTRCVVMVAAIACEFASIIATIAFGSSSLARWSHSSQTSRSRNTGIRSCTSPEASRTSRVRTVDDSVHSHVTGALRGPRRPAAAKSWSSAWMKWGCLPSGSASHSYYPIIGTRARAPANAEQNIPIVAAVSMRALIGAGPQSFAQLGRSPP